MKRKSIRFKQLLEEFCIVEKAVAGLSLTVRPRNKASKSPKSLSDGKNGECQQKKVRTIVM
jgi:hypothetical protein